MACVDPIKERKHLRCAERYLKKNHDPAFALIWKIGLESGLRISDILKLTYQHIDLSSGQCRVIESKGTLARQAKAKSRVLKQVKEELLLHYQEKGHLKAMSRLYITAPQHILPLIPNTWRSMVEKRIHQAMENTAPVIRHFSLSLGTLKKLIARQAQYGQQDTDSLFSRQTLSSNRAKGQSGLLTRQACWLVFSKLTEVLKNIGIQVRVGCHSLRKSFARHLYFATGKDIGLLMTMIGHQSEKMSLHYIGVSGDEVKEAQQKLIVYLSSQ